MLAKAISQGVDLKRGRVRFEGFVRSRVSTDLAAAGWVTQRPGVTARGVGAPIVRLVGGSWSG